MKLPYAVGGAVLAGVLTLATIGFLGYRLLEQSRSGADSVPTGLVSSQQLTPDEAQAAADAVMRLTLRDLAGQPQTMAQWRSKVLVVNFWASWCAPCVEEMPAFARLQDEYAGRGVQFVGIGIDEVENMQSFVKTRPVTYPLLAATPAISDTPGLRIKGLPFTLVIARDGQLAMSRLGRLDEAKLEPILRRLSGQ